jgi:ABC-type enterochelin transport system permease subunit
MADKTKDTTCSGGGGCGVISSRQVWLTTISCLMDKLLIACSYSAMNQGNKMIAKMSYSASSKEIFQIMCTILYFLVAVRVSAHEGLQNVLIMIAAKSFSAGVPLPQEPSGSLVLPAVLVYFATAALIMEYAYRAGVKRDNNDTVKYA